MKLANHRFFVITLAAWLVTVAVAFSIGRLMVPAGSSSIAGGAQNASAGGSKREGSASSTGGGAAHPGGRGAQFAADDAAGGLTVASLTNGQPLDKWVKNLLSQEDEIVRMTGLLRLLTAVTDPAELRTALEAVNLRGDRGFGRGSRFAEYGMLLSKWTQLDPKGAMAFVEGRSREERWLGATTVLRTWTRLDPEAAITWAGTKGKDFTAGDDGPGGPGGWAPQGNIAVASVISQLAHSDIDRALTLGSTQTFDPRSRTFDTLASELINQRGLEAARTAMEALPEGAFRDGLALQLAGRLAAKDASGTAKWALTLPAGETQSRALAEVVGEWARTDPTAAGNFLTGLPATPEADRSRESYAQTVVQKDPAGAMAWANAITDESRRLRTVESVARAWLRADATAANAWISQSPLPDEVKARIQSPSGGGSSRGRGPRPGN